MEYEITARLPEDVPEHHIREFVEMVLKEVAPQGLERRVREAKSLVCLRVDGHLAVCPAALVLHANRARISIRRSFTPGFLGVSREDAGSRWPAANPVCSRGTRFGSHGTI